MCVFHHFKIQYEVLSESQNKTCVGIILRKKQKSHQVGGLLQMSYILCF